MRGASREVARSARMGPAQNPAVETPIVCPIAAAAVGQRFVLDEVLACLQDIFEQ